MMKMKELIKRNITGKKVLLLFLLTNIVYALMLIVTIPMAMNYSNGMKLLDMMPTGYSAEYVNLLFSTLGENGRNAYLFKQIPLDMIYPLLFGISYSLVFAYFLNKLDKLNGPLIYISLIPLAAGAFDYLENIGIIVMLSNYPGISNLALTATNLFTILKSLFTTVYFVVLLITYVAVVIKQINEKRKKS